MRYAGEAVTPSLKVQWTGGCAAGYDYSQVAFGHRGETAQEYELINLLELRKLAPAKKRSFLKNQILSSTFSAAKCFKVFPNL